MSETAPAALTAAAQDPAELFEIVRADGTPTGRTKPRAAVHRDGDWHRSLHVWVAGVGPEGAFLTFQRRGLGKDTWPGRLDATVGGHFGVGEGVAEALREVEEELGVAPPAEALRPLGTRLCANEAETDVIDRELQTVLLWRDDRPLPAFRPNPAEVAALVRFDLAAALALLGGEVSSIGGDLLPAGDREARVRVERFSVDAFMPTIDNYFYRVAIAAAAALRGERHVAV